MLMRRRVLDGLLSSLGPENIVRLFWKEASHPELRTSRGGGGGALAGIWARQDRAIYHEASGASGDGDRDDNYDDINMDDSPRAQIPKGNRKTESSVHCQAPVWGRSRFDLVALMCSFPL